MTAGKDVTDAPEGGDRTRKASAANSKKSGATDKDMGAALRSVYQKTVEEAVPQDLLSLLGKLD